ncbi:unnamed protein product [Camellia sinensis]
MAGAKLMASLMASEEVIVDSIAGGQLEATTVLSNGSWKSTTGRAGLACVCFDEQQNEVYQQACKTQLSSPLLAEAKAVVMAIQWALQTGIAYLSLFTDRLLSLRID